MRKRSIKEREFQTFSLSFQNDFIEFILQTQKEKNETRFIEKDICTFYVYKQCSRKA